MAERAGKRLYLSDTLKQTTEALAQLDTEAIERLLVQLKAVGSGAVEVGAESTEAIVESHKLLAAVLSVTEKNLKVLDRLHERQCGMSVLHADARRQRVPWAQ